MTILSELGLFSPQAWGCTSYLPNQERRPIVFPTGVGVYRGRALRR